MTKVLDKHVGLHYFRNSVSSHLTVDHQLQLAMARVLYGSVLIRLTLIHYAVSQLIDDVIDDVKCDHGCKNYGNLMDCRRKNLDKFPCISDNVNVLTLRYNPLPSPESNKYLHVENLYIRESNKSHVNKALIEMFPNVYYLGLYRNKIKCFDSRVLTDLSNLMFFSVDGNEITKALIRELPGRIKAIGLQNNKLTTVTFSERFKENMIKMRNDGFSNMLRIYLSGNPIVCGCKFRKTLLTLDPVVKFEGFCRDPLSLRGKKISEVVFNCTKTEEDLDFSVKDAFANEGIDDGDDVCEDERQNKQTEDNKNFESSNNEFPERSAGTWIIGRSLRDMISFGLIMIFIIVY